MNAPQDISEQPSCFVDHETILSLEKWDRDGTRIPEIIEWWQKSERENRDNELLRAADLIRARNIAFSEICAALI